MLLLVLPKKSINYIGQKSTRALKLAKNELLLKPHKLHIAFHWSVFQERKSYIENGSKLKWTRTYWNKIWFDSMNRVNLHWFFLFDFDWFYLSSKSFLWKAFTRIVNFQTRRFWFNEYTDSHRTHHTCTCFHVNEIKHRKHHGNEIKKKNHWRRKNSLENWPMLKNFHCISKLVCEMTLRCPVIFSDFYSEANRNDFLIICVSIAFEPHTEGHIPIAERLHNHPKW